MWELKRKKGEPIYQSIIDLIISLIREGKLLPGQRLPAERKLAEFFQVNRSTVVHALEELAANGILIRKQGSGTIVNEGKWGLFTKPTIDWRQYLPENTFSSIPPYVEKMQQLLKKNDPQLIDTYTGELPLDLVPAFQLPAVSWKSFLKEEDRQDEFGYTPLREAVRDMIYKDYDLNLSKDQLLLTSGAQQALFLIIQVLLQAGDAVAIEEPSFFYPLSLFQAAGIRLYGVPVDREGMQVDRLEQEIIRHKVKMVLVNPTFQNPTATVMSRKRRVQLIELCRKYQIPIVEDDVFGQLSFDLKTKMIPLKKLDPENVLYIGSLSKILGSTTKIGWLSAPPAVLQQLARARMEMDFSLSIFPQVMANFALQDPTYDSKISGLKEELEKRCQKFIENLEQETRGEFQWHRPTGGYYIWLKAADLRIGIKEMDYLLEQNLLTMPSFLFGEKEFALRINFTRLDEEKSLLTAKKLHQAYEHWFSINNEKK